MDGFSISSSNRPSLTSKLEPKRLVVQSGLTTPIRVSNGVRRSPAAHAKAHKPQATHILMRQSVKKPSAGIKKQINVQSELMHQVPAVIATKMSVHSINPSRLERAKNVAKSQHIYHYSHQAAPKVRPLVTSLQVKQAPPLITEHSVVSKPLDLFENALANASNFVDTQSSKLHFKKKARRHVASMSAGVLALVILGSFLAYQNVPGVQLKIASIRAGVQTGMPNFQAAGFAFNHVIKHKSNQLTIGFSGHGANYQLVQQPTNWSSNEMIQNISSTDASGTPNYTTIDTKGPTVYRLANNSATWVSDGKWYQVNGTGSLSDYQLKNLVSNI